MVRLTAKGQNQYVDANTPTALGQSEALVVLASLRNAVNTLVDLSTGPWNEATVKEAVALKEIVQQVRAEVEEMDLILHVVEQRIMDL